SISKAPKRRNSQRNRGLTQRISFIERHQEEWIWRNSVKRESFQHIFLSLVVFGKAAECSPVVVAVGKT
ncbi:MAG: hypothetical protein VX024_06410, partial [SAR324 cluster bacterium]|nr:hypothetical protein [SAR324 cluster bacterium]